MLLRMKTSRTTVVGKTQNDSGFRPNSLKVPNSWEDSELSEGEGLEDGVRQNPCLSLTKALTFP